MERRRLAYVGAVFALLVTGWFVRSSFTTPEPAHSTVSPKDDAGADEAATPPVALRQPPLAVAEVGVLTERREASLAGVLDRDHLATLVGPELCGDERTCEAVRATLKDEATTTLRVAASSEWASSRADFDASAAKLSVGERTGLGQRDTVVIVRVATAVSPRQLAIRTAFATAGAVAAAVDGLVYDSVLGRIEDARVFAKHAVTATLDDSAFRLDRIQLLYEPRGEGIVRLLTAGLERFGAPDVEAAAVPIGASERVAEIVLGVAAAIANGARFDPIVLSSADLARAGGTPFDDGGSSRIALDVVSMHPEAGDPNDFIVRIEPPGGEGPMGYVELAERFFGPILSLAPDDATLRDQYERAQRGLGSALARWSGMHAGGARLLVRLPFAIAGDAGVESMWVEITGYGASTITGLVVDDPVAATEVARGDRVTRPRTDVEDLRAR